MNETELILCVIEHHAMKTYADVKQWLHAFLASALEGVSGSTRRQCYIWGKRPQWPVGRRLGGTKVRVMKVKTKRRSPPAGNKGPARPVSHLVAWPCAILVTVKYEGRGTGQALDK
jgi:hypothetical protein